jgi:hypothetical protein
MKKSFTVFLIVLFGITNSQGFYFFKKEELPPEKTYWAYLKSPNFITYVPLLSIVTSIISTR